MFTGWMVRWTGSQWNSALVCKRSHWVVVVNISVTYPRVQESMVLGGCLGGKLSELSQVYWLRRWYDWSARQLFTKFHVYFFSSRLCLRSPKNRVEPMQPLRLLCWLMLVIAVIGNLQQTGALEQT